MQDNLSTKKSKNLDKKITPEEQKEIYELFEKIKKSILNFLDVYTPKEFGKENPDRDVFYLWILDLWVNIWIITVEIHLSIKANDPSKANRKFLLRILEDKKQLVTTVPAAKKEIDNIHEQIKEYARLLRKINKFSFFNFPYKEEIKRFTYLEFSN